VEATPLGLTARNSRPIAVVDPFGILGVMYNPHYVEILAAR
jgi:hypothetical protein